MRLRRLLLPVVAVAAALCASAPPAGAAVGPRYLTVMTYNVAHARLAGGDLARLAAVIRSAAPDVVGLQELDWSWSRSGGPYQAQELGRLLGMHVYFDPNLDCAQFDTENDGFCRYGTAILSRHPFVLGTGRQFTLFTSPNQEPRGLARIVINVAGRQVEVFNTHLSFVPGDRLREAQQIAALLGRDRRAFVLTGDLNSLAFFREIHYLRLVAGDVQSLARQPGLRTTNGAHPVRLDYVFAARGIAALSARVIYSPLSDHRPLVVRVRVPGIPGPLL